MDPESRPRGQRLTALRHIEGITQATLAAELEVSQPFLSQIERGMRPPPDNLVHAVAKKFGVPVSFFAVPQSPLDAGPATFRKTSKASVRDEDRVTTLYDEASRLFRTVSERSGFRAADLPDPGEHHDDPEIVAAAMRQVAGLGRDEPVKNATRMLERFGIGVVDHLDEVGHEGGHTGVSRPSRLNSRPLVALADHVPGAVKRLTLLHEAYHLIADRDLSEPISSRRSLEETRAFRFASAILIPEDVVRARTSQTLNLHGYLPIKADYGISVGALLRRSFDLGVISDHRYRSLSIQLSSQGWRMDEPVHVSDETPQLLGQALRKVYGAQPHLHASKDVGVAPAWIHRWTRTAEGVEDQSAPEQGLGRVIDINDARSRRVN